MLTAHMSWLHYWPYIMAAWVSEDSILAGLWSSQFQIQTLVAWYSSRFALEPPDPMSILMNTRECYNLPNVYHNEGQVNHLSVVGLTQRFDTPPTRMGVSSSEHRHQKGYVLSYCCLTKRATLQNRDCRQTFMILCAACSRRKCDGTFVAGLGAPCAS